MINNKTFEEIKVGDNATVERMLTQQLAYLHRAASGGIVVGARVPIILTSRGRTLPRPVWPPVLSLQPLRSS